MILSSNKTSINYIKPLYAIAMVLGLSPPSAIAKICNFRIYRFYACFVTLALLCETGASFYYKYETMYEYTIVLIAIDVIVGVLITLTLCTAVTRSIFQDEQFRLFVKLFLEFDSSENIQIENSKTRMYGQLLFVHLLTTSLTSYNLYLSLKVADIFTFLITWYKIVYHYFNTILTMLIYNFVSSLKLRFKWLNARLHNELNNKCEDTPGKTEMWNNVIKTRKLYTQLNKLVTLYNKIFGWQILCLTITISLEFLETINAVITFLKYKFKEDVISNIDVAILTLSWCSSFVVSK